MKVSSSADRVEIAILFTIEFLVIDGGQLSHRRHSAGQRFRNALYFILIVQIRDCSRVVKKIKISANLWLRQRRKLIVRMSHNFESRKCTSGDHEKATYLISNHKFVFTIFAVINFILIVIDPIVYQR